jgi:FixJ family two-component response regulator
MSEPLPRVYLVDDDASVRKALTRVLESAGHPVETFESARQFLASGRAQCSPGCLVLDVRMPELSGLDLQEELRRANALLPIVFITGHGDIPMSVRAMKAGAADFLAKPVKAADLKRAVATALARAMRDHGRRREYESILGRVKLLTPREREVMTLVVAGRLNKQIADELGTVEQTVKVHRGRVMEKMQADSLPDLVRMADMLKAASSVPEPESSNGRARP